MDCNNFYFHVSDGWNIQSFLNINGGVEYFRCTTKQAHFEASVVFTQLTGEVHVIFNQGFKSNNEYNYISKEKDVNLLLQEVFKSITAHLINEALTLRNFMRKNLGYKAND